MEIKYLDPEKEGPQTKTVTVWVCRRSSLIPIRNLIDSNSDVFSGYWNQWKIYFDQKTRNADWAIVSLGSIVALPLSLVLKTTEALQSVVVDCHSLQQ